MPSRNNTIDLSAVPTSSCASAHSSVLGNEEGNTPRPRGRRAAAAPPDSSQGIPDSLDRWAERRIRDYNPTTPEVDHLLKVYKLAWPDTPPAEA
eukprot:6208855-Pleurochrysis_carterae.AAC.1